MNEKIFFPNGKSRLTKRANELILIMIINGNNGRGAFEERCGEFFLPHRTESGGNDGEVKT